MKKILSKIWPLLFILGAWFIFASPYLVKGLIPFPSKYLVTFFPPWSAQYGMPVKNNAMPDVITQIYPWKKLTIDTWKMGQVPLWNPYSFSGTPHSANNQTAVFSPLNLLFLLLPELSAWSWLILLQPLLAGLLMYLYLRELALGKSAGLVGSLAFMFCGFLVVWMAYGTLGYAVLWLPLALFAVHRFFRRGTWWSPLLLALSLVCSLFSGHFQISIYVLSVVLIYLATTGWVHRDWLKSLWLLLFFFGGILIAAPQLLPSLAAYQNALRSGDFVQSEVIPWHYLITLFAPDFYGNPVTRNDWFGHYAEWASYIGVIPLLLACLTLFGKKNRHIWFFWAVVLAGLLLAFATPFNDWLFRLKIPVLATSAASRIIVLVSFSLAVLSAIGLENLFSRKTKTLAPRLLIFLLTTGFWLAVLWLILLGSKILPPEKLIIAKRNNLLPTLLAFGGILMIWLTGYTTKKWRTGVVLVILGLTVFDLLRFAGKWMPFDPASLVYPTLPAMAFLQKTIGNQRVFGNVGGEAAITFSLPSIEGYDAIYPDRYGRFISAVNTGRVAPAYRSVVLLGKAGKYKEEVLELLGVKYLLHRKSDGRNVWTYPFWQYPYYRRIYEDGFYEVFDNTRAFPRALLAGSYRVVTDPQQIIDTLFAPGFNRREELVLEENPVREPETGEGKVEIISYTPNRMLLRTESAVPKLLFVSDSFDPGWQATVDGQPEKVYRADFDFRAVSVPAGEHLVTFRYWPESFNLGLKIAGITFGLSLVASFLFKQYENRFL